MSKLFFNQSLPGLCIFEGFASLFSLTGTGSEEFKLKGGKSDFSSDSKNWIRFSSTLWLSNIKCIESLQVEHQCVKCSKSKKILIGIGCYPKTNIASRVRELVSWIFDVSCVSKAHYHSSCSSPLSIQHSFFSLCMKCNFSLHSPYSNFAIDLRWVGAKVLTRSGSKVEVLWRETMEKNLLYLLWSTKGFFCLKILNHFSRVTQDYKRENPLLQRVQKVQKCVLCDFIFFIIYLHWNGVTCTRS